MPRKDRTFTSRDVVRIFERNLNISEQQSVLIELCGTAFPGLDPGELENEFLEDLAASLLTLTTGWEVALTVGVSFLAQALQEVNPERFTEDVELLEEIFRPRTKEEANQIFNNLLGPDRVTLEDMIFRGEGGR